MSYAPIIFDAIDVRAAFKNVSAGKLSTLVDNFSAMKIKVRRENGALVFIPDERGIVLQVENIEIKKPE